jgi:hypothetical protein
VQPEFGSRSRPEEIRRRLEAIQTRLQELKAKRRDDTSPAAFGERLASSLRYKAASQAFAEQASAASTRALLSSAEAHRRAALQHERSIAAGYGDKDQHEQRAAAHLAAAVADTQRAQDAELTVYDEDRGQPPGGE